MIDVIIHIENESEIWDENVFVECKLPAVPQIGSILHLSHELDLMLAIKAHHSKTKENYFPQYFYRNYAKEFENLHEDKLPEFTDCVTVKHVKYESNSPIVRITLGV